MIESMFIGKRNPLYLQRG